MRVFLRSVFVLVVAFLAFATLALADPTAVLTGFITDPHSAAVPGAKITVVNLNTGVQYTVESNNVGLYNTPPLEPGVYRMTIGKDGFKTIVKTDVELHVQDTISVNFALEVGSVSESVTVEAGASSINTVDATVSMTVTRDLVDNLPLNGRSFQQLITLTPGVNLIGSVGSTGSSTTGEFSVNGQRATANYFTVDGVSANIGMTSGNSGGFMTNGVGNAAGGTNAMVSVDALQEFRILTSSFAPEYGRTPGGQVILLTRSGTNQFHGTLYDYFRNTVLDANDWFANQAGQPRSPLQFNDFGGTFGGPIIKNNTFFFFSYEGQRLLQPLFAVTSVPDVASRLAAPPATQFILKAWPLPNGSELGGGLAQFAAGYSNPINTNATSIRLDHRFSDNLNAFVRYSYAPSFSTTRQPGNSLAEVLTGPRLAQTITGGTTYAITPRLINELRLNFSDTWVKLSYALDNFGGAAPPSVAALYGSPTPSSEAFAGLYTNWGALQDGSLERVQQRQINLTDGFAWALGSHQLKFGFDYLRQLPINGGAVQLFEGFSDVGSIVRNALSFAGGNQTAPIHSDITELSLYAQDTWHASSRLTLTYGLRWDFNPPPTSRYPNNQDYIPITVNSAGNVTLGQAGSSYWNTQYKNFAPRLGVAYTLRQVPGKETVLRGGIGLFYDLGTEASPLTGFSSYPVEVPTSPGNVSSFPIPAQNLTLPAINLTNPPVGSPFNSWARNFTSPKTWQWNLSIQQALGSTQTVAVSYVASLGRDLVYGQVYPNLGPNKYYVDFYNNAGTSNYQSLQLQYQRRLSHGLSAIAAYTWAHSIDTNSDDISYNSIPTSLVNANINRGPSDFDIRHTFSGAVSYSIPGNNGRGLLQALSNGWGLDAIISARSAPPVDIVSRYNSIYGSLYLRPNLVPGVPLYVADANAPDGEVINSAALMTNPNGQGDLGRNAFRGFDLVETDLSARRTFRLSERFSLLFRADLFNLFNHPNFANPNGVLSRSFFGQSTAMANTSVGGSGAGNNAALNSAFQTGGPRTAQLSLKLQF